MAKRYFELTDDVHLPERWDLGTPTTLQGEKLDDWLFTEGKPVPDKGRLKVPIRAYDGKVLDYTEAGISVPVVSAKVAAVFSELAPHDVQLIPVDVEPHPEPFFILVCTRIVKCIDDEKSGDVQYWKPEDNRPDKTGTYRFVPNMRIDTSQVGDTQVFRTWGWNVLVVSEAIQQALERAGAIGTHFCDVTIPPSSTPEERELSRRSRERRERITSARDAFWRSLGSLDEAIIPIVAGGSWPGQCQAWRVIRRPSGTTLLVTDGLSDFFVDREEPSVGFGLELALETDAAMKNAYKSWPVHLLSQVSHEVAEHEHVREGLHSGLSSMEVSGKSMPKAFVTREGRVGVLLGLRSPSLPSHFSMPDGQVRLVTVKLLLPVELDYLLAHGSQGYSTLSRLFLLGDDAHLSRSRRMPVFGLPR